MPAPDKTTLNRWRQDIRFNALLREHTLTYTTTWGIFSPESIDAGTQLLLDYMEVPADADCLDIGCGYGPIGMTLAKLAPQGQTLMVDKDFMAVEYANKNCALNGINNAKAMLSIGRTNAFIRVYEASPSSATGPRAGFRRGFLWSRGTPVVAWRLLGDVKSAAWRAVNAPGPVLIRVDPYRPSQRPAVCLKSVQPDVR